MTQEQDEQVPAFADLPAAVRHRLVAWVAAGLPDLATLPPLPPALRRVRDFAPARRARAGAAAIGVALDDDAFRTRAAVLAPSDDQDAGDGSDGPGVPDPAISGARAWLVRDEGWQAVLAEVASALHGSDPERLAVEGRLTRLEQRLEAAHESAREVRARHRGELAALRAENARLRGALGEERRASRQDADTVRDRVAAAEQAQQAAEALAAARERELRQLQARLDRAESEAGAGRRAARADREDATLRARLLLDTVLDAAAGLRRELALPSATGTPGERAERDLAPPGVREPTSAGGLGSDSAALLDQYLAMPRARLLVDGYNVTRSTWDTQPLEAQRARLLRALAPLVARTGAETTVVFDAHQVGARPLVAAPRGVRVLFSPEGVIADDVLRDLVAAEPEGRVVVVVTSDAELAGDVRRAGARVCSARSLLALLPG